MCLADWNNFSDNDRESQKVATKKKNKNIEKKSGASYEKIYFVLFLSQPNSMLCRFELIKNKLFVAV